MVNIKFKVPDSLFDKNKLVNLDSIDNKRIYFIQPPVEMYLISFLGQVILSDVYNEKIVKNDWVSERSKISALERQRIFERFQKEILNSIEQMAKKDGIVDSLIYK